LPVTRLLQLPLGLAQTVEAEQHQAVVDPDFRQIRIDQEHALEGCHGARQIAGIDLRLGVAEVEPQVVGIVEHVLEGNVPRALDGPAIGRLARGTRPCFTLALFLFKPLDLRVVWCLGLDRQGQKEAESNTQTDGGACRD